MVSIFLVSRSKGIEGIFATAVVLVTPMSFDANSAFLVAPALAFNLSRPSAFMPLAFWILTMTTMIIMMTMSSRTRTTTTMLKVLDSNRVELLRHRHGCGVSTQNIERDILFTFLSLPHNSFLPFVLNSCSSPQRYQTALVL